MNMSFGRSILKLSCFLLIIIIITSCSMNDQSNLNLKKYIEEDAIWWDDLTFSVMPNELSNENLPTGCFYQVQSVSYVNENLYPLFSGITFDNNDYSNSWIIGLYSPHENDVFFDGTIDISGLLNDSDSWVINVLGVIEYRNRICVIVEKQFSCIKGDSLYLYELDFADKQLTYIDSFDFDTNESNKTDIDCVCSTGKEIYCVGHTKTVYNEISYNLYVIKEGNITDTSLIGIDFVSGDITVDSNNNVIVPAVVSNELTLLTYDDSGVLLSENSIQHRNVSLCQGGAYELKNRILYSLKDFDDEAVCLDFNDTNVAYINSCEIISIGDERVVFINGNDITILSKSDSNPNVGKQIIEVAFFAEITEMESYGIKAFNDSSKNYFAIFTDKYCYWNFLENDRTLTTEEYTFAIIDAQSVVVNRLKQDIDLGEGPDLLLGFSEVWELQNDKYILNIQSYIEDNNFINEEQYLTSVLKAAYFDDGVYTVPLSYTMTGILIKDSIGEDYGVGIPVGEYEAFIKNFLNGNDPLYCYDNKYSYFNRLLSCSYDMFVNADGEYNFDCEAFKEISQYVYKNVPDEIDNSYEETIYIGTISGAIELHSGITNKKLLGLPTYDARGPQFIFLESASITKCSSCVDGAMDVIDILLSEKIQDYSLNPICKASYMRLAVNPYDGSNLNETVINKYLSFIEAGTGYYSVDYAVLGIIDEEIQGYFAGQQKLDDVINVINSRVNTYVKEKS